MAMTVEQLAVELLELPASKRAYLAQKLMASLEDEEYISEDVDAAWIKEVKRRRQEFLDGKTTCQPLEEALREVDQEFAR